MLWVELLIFVFLIEHNTHGIPKGHHLLISMNHISILFRLQVFFSITAWSPTLDRAAMTCVKIIQHPLQHADYCQRS